MLPLPDPLGGMLLQFCGWYISASYRTAPVNAQRVLYSGFQKRRSRGVENVQSLCKSRQDWSRWIEPRRAGDCFIWVSCTSCSSTSSLCKDGEMQKVPARPDLRPSMSSSDGRSRDGVCSLQQLLAVVVIVVIIFRASVSSVSCHYRSFIIVITTGTTYNSMRVRTSRPC